MAKGSAMGLWKGKKGSSVFYRIWNSNNKEVQGIREYRAEIRNPQSDRQADQRAQLLPVQLVKGALREVLSRSFQGVEYGAKSLLEFRRLAMRETSGYPYLTRGTTTPVPGTYLVSKGSLGDIELAWDQTEQAHESPFLLDADTDISPAATVGSLCTVLINQNQGRLLEGDQLTIIACLSVKGALNWAWFSFYLDPSSAELLGDLYQSGVVIADTDQNRLAVSGTNDNAVAAAIIHSREGGLYLRSTSRISVSPALDSYFSASAGITTRASYQDAGTGETDWPVEDSTRADAGAIDGLYTLSGLTGAMAACNGVKVRVRLNANNAPVAVYVNTTQEPGVQYLVSESNALVSYDDGQGGLLFLGKTQVPALASLPGISV